MSFTTTASSIQATATALLALTTPFIQPPGCERDLTQTRKSPSIEYIQTYTVLNSTRTYTKNTYIPVLEPVASCVPSGWDKIVPQSRYHFSPAVCPSAWIYYDMAAVTSDGSSATTAFCCARSIFFIYILLLSRALKKFMILMTVLQWIYVRTQ